MFLEIVPSAHATHICRCLLRTFSSDTELFHGNPCQTSEPPPGSRFSCCVYFQRYFKLEALESLLWEILLRAASCVQRERELFNLHTSDLHRRINITVKTLFCQEDFNLCFRNAFQLLLLCVMESGRPLVWFGLAAKVCRDQWKTVRFMMFWASVIFYWWRKTGNSSPKEKPKCVWWE